MSHAGYNELDLSAVEVLWYEVYTTSRKNLMCPVKST